VGSLAQKRLARGTQLNAPEAIALIASQTLEFIRDGKHSVAELMQVGRTLLGTRHVLPEVPSMVHEVQVEGTFPDGTFLVTIHDPICSEDGNLERALWGSFLPVPDNSIFPPAPNLALPDTSDMSVTDDQRICAQLPPGAYVVGKEPIYLCPDRKRVLCKVQNNGDRPIQVVSHSYIQLINSLIW
jgi:urease